MIPHIALQRAEPFPLAAPVKVKARGQLSWAYRDPKGRWRSFLNNRKLHGKVKLVWPDFLKLA
jgi:hypothetical protein